MQEKHIHKLRIRRGSNSQRKEVRFEDGELVYVNDKKKLYVGDMKTVGGIKASNNNQIILKKELPINADTGDILYNKLHRAVYIVNKSEELESVIFSSDDYYKYLKQIEDLEALLENLEKFCCNKDFALDTDDGINILADYGDWIVAKYPDFFVSVCKSPIISSKYLKLKSNKTYTLDITNYNSDSDIIFTNNLVDRDINTTIQPIKIVENSVVASSNLKILEITDTTIKFYTDPLPNSISIGMNVFIDYNIENDCGALQTEKGSIGGYVYNSILTLLSRNIDEVKKEASNFKYQMYQILDPITKDYPWDKGCWFLFYFNSFDEFDNYYITMFDKFPIISNGSPNVNSYIYGPIGPVKYKGMYLFYHPINTDLNIWNNGYGNNEWRVFPVYNTKEHPNSPNRFFTNVNIKPSVQQLQTMLLQKGLTYEKDYTDIYNNNVVPSFIKIF